MWEGKAELCPLKPGLGEGGGGGGGSHSQPAAVSHILTKEATGTIPAREVATFSPLIDFCTALWENVPPQLSSPYKSDLRVSRPSTSFL